MKKIWEFFLKILRVILCFVVGIIAIGLILLFCYGLVMCPDQVLVGIFGLALIPIAYWVGKMIVRMVDFEIKNKKVGK